jgi:anti-sigma B factor antagonist
MRPAKPGLSVRSINAQVSIIDLVGEVTALSENALMDAYTEACRPTTRALLLNFSRLEYMNSAGMGLIMALVVRATHQKQRLLAFGMSDHYRRIFRITRLDDALRICLTETEALAAAQEAPGA